ncbi:MAG TPA: hypothetical protein VMC85_25290 [Desulfomonilaceae bacterium]|nr:hypothetical protein [Desulfomonilaceae bacterium]HVN80444.1 hypothetical protein [Terriglobia bacterium]
MKKAVIQFAAVLFLISMSAVTISAQNVSAGVSIASGHSSFYLAIGDYYHVPESRVVYVSDHYRIRDEELPVVFFLASRAHVDPQVIIDLRMRHRLSWLDITFHYGLTPEIYYVPVTRVGPPYGNAYGHYKKHQKDYKKVVLVDDDVVNLVNLRFMSEYHGKPAEVVMDRRGRGERFVAMNDEFREEKRTHGDRDDDRGNGKDKHEKGKDKKEKNKG